MYLSLLSRIYQQTENIYSETSAKCLIMFIFLDLLSPLYLTVLASILGKMQRALKKSRQLKAGHFAGLLFHFIYVYKRYTLET